MLKLFLDSKRLRVGDRADVSLAFSLPFSEVREGFADWPTLWRGGLEGKTDV